MCADIYCKYNTTHGANEDNGNSDDYNDGISHIDMILRKGGLLSKCY